MLFEGSFSNVDTTQDGQEYARKKFFFLCNLHIVSLG